MNMPPEDPDTGATPPAPPEDETPGRWLLGCLGKALLVFFVVVLLVFGACFTMLM